MKRLALAATLALALIVPASASAAEYNRQIATRCEYGPNGRFLRAFKVIDGTNYLTQVACEQFDPNTGKTTPRPWTDFQAAGNAANRWWGHCSRNLYSFGWSDTYPNQFNTYWHLVCP